MLKYVKGKQAGLYQEWQFEPTNQPRKIHLKVPAY